MAKGIEFETAVTSHISPLVTVKTIATDTSASRDINAADQTFESMLEGVPIISQAVLRDHESSTYGIADFLVRSDLLCKLIPSAITEKEAVITAPDLDREP